MPAALAQYLSMKNATDHPLNQHWRSSFLLVSFGQMNITNSKRAPEKPGLRSQKTDI
jgi:hypothetical protein